MLRHIDEGAAATAIEHAVVYTFEQGIHTGDMLGTGNPVSTTGFADAVIANLGKRSSISAQREHGHFRVPPMTESVRSEEHTSELQSLMRISYAVFCLKK